MLSSFWVGSIKQGPHSPAAKAGSLGKGGGGSWRSVIAGQKRACIAWRGTSYASAAGAPRAFFTCSSSAARTF